MGQMNATKWRVLIEMSTVYVSECPGEATNLEFVFLWVVCSVWPSGGKHPGVSAACSCSCSYDNSRN